MLLTALTEAGKETHRFLVLDLAILVQICHGQPVFILCAALVLLVRVGLHTLSSRGVNFVFLHLCHPELAPKLPKRQAALLIVPEAGIILEQVRTQVRLSTSANP